PPDDWLAAEAVLARDLYRRCDYAGLLVRLVELIPGLHAAAHGQHPRQALQAMVPVYGVAMGSLLNLGYPAHAWAAVERCSEAAQRLDDAVTLAVAAINSARVNANAGAFAPARTVCARAADELERGHLGQPAALEALGFLHLTGAHHMVGLKDVDVADA